AALIRGHQTFAGDDFPGFDQLMLVNLTTDMTLDNPRFGAGDRTHLQGLLQGGLANNPFWSPGKNPVPITQLAPGRAYVTLIPTNTTGFNVEATFGGKTYRASSPELADGQVMYLTSSQVAGLTGADIDHDGSIDLLAVGPDGTLTTWHNVTGGPLLFGAVGGTTSGGHDIGVHIAGSESVTIQGTVFLDNNQSGTWNPSKPGLHDGVLVYVDLNNNGSLDKGEPSQQPSVNGAYRFANLKPGTYAIRLALGTEGIDPATMKQTFPAGTNAPVNVTLTAPGGVFFGADFGVAMNASSGDFNLDG